MRRKLMTGLYFLARGPQDTISDNEHAPINEFADHKLIAKSNVYSFVDSLLAPLSAINALFGINDHRFKKYQKTKQTFNSSKKSGKNIIFFW